MFIKWNFGFQMFSWNWYSDWLDYYCYTFKSFIQYLYILNVFLFNLIFNRLKLQYKHVFNNKTIKKYLFFIDNSIKLKNKFLFFILRINIFSENISRYFTLIRFYRGRRARLKRHYKNRLFKKKRRKTKNSLGVLHVSFKKRNVFFNLSNQFFKTLYLTTLRKQGFLGRRRQEYLSIWSTVQMIKQKIKRFKLQTLALVYTGWNRFRVAIKNSLRSWDLYKVPLCYARFVVKIPHNGCRVKKKKEKKRKKKIWLRRRKNLLKPNRKWMPFFTKHYYVNMYKLSVNPFEETEKKYYKKNKNVQY